MLAAHFSYKHFVKLRKITSISSFSGVFVMNGCWISGPFVLIFREILQLATLALIHCSCWRFVSEEVGRGAGVFFKLLIKSQSFGGTVCFCRGGLYRYLCPSLEFFPSPTFFLDCDAPSLFPWSSLTCWLQFSYSLDDTGILEWGWSG